MGARLQPRKRGWKLWETQSSCTRDGMPSGTFELEENCLEILGNGGSWAGAEFLVFSDFAFVCCVFLLLIEQLSVFQRARQLSLFSVDGWDH